MSIIKDVEPLTVGDCARALVPLKKPGKWGRKGIIVRNVTVVGILGDFVQVKVPGRKETVAMKRADIQSFWRHAEEAAKALTPCHACEYEYDREGLGKYGCPNCHGEGLE